MIRRTGKIALELAGVAVAATAVLLAVLAWRLSSGPVSLSILNQMIEDAANPSLQGGSLTIGDTVLLWTAQDRELSLRLNEVHLSGAEGNTVASVPQLAFKLSIPALFRGRLAPTSIDLYGVQATILRRPGTGITFALSRDTDPPDPEAGDFIGPMLEAMLAGNDPSSPFGYLDHLGIRDAKLNFVDEVNGVDFHAPMANLAVSRGNDGLEGVLAADVAIDNTTAHLEMDGVLPTKADAAGITAHVTNLVPAALARLSPAFADYAIFDTPLAADGDLLIKTDGALQSARLSLRAGEGKINLPSPWDTSIVLEDVQGHVELDGVAQKMKLTDLTFKAGPHEASLKGTIAYRIGRGLNIASADVDLVTGRFHTQVPDFFVGPVDLDEVRLKATIDFETMKADIATLFIGAAGGALRLSGSIADAPRSPALKVTGRIEPMPFEKMTAIWPLPLAKGAREWVARNLSGGTVTGGSFDLDLPGGMIADAADHIEIPKGHLHFEFVASGFAMKYLGEMPPMENVEAHGLVEDDRFDAWVTSAVIRQKGMGEIAVSNGHFLDDDLHKKGAEGIIAFTAAGTTADILSLLDHEPLHLIGKFGLDPRSVGGTGKLIGEVSLPLVKEVTMDDVDFSGTAHAQNITIPDIQKDISITSGSLDIKVTRAGLAASGPVGINNVPPLDLVWQESFRANASPSSTYRLRGVIDDEGRHALGLRLDKFISGPARIDATLTGDGRNINRASVTADLGESAAMLDYAGWVKKPGDKAMVAFDLALLEGDAYRISDFELRGDGIETDGEITLAGDGRLIAADFPVVKLGPFNDFSFKAGVSEDAALAMVLKGARFDARGVLSDMLSGGGADDGERAADPLPLLDESIAADPLRRKTLRADIAELTGGHETSFSDVHVSLVQADERIWSMSVDATDQAGAPVTVKIAPSGPGKRVLAVSSSDAGNIFRALDLTHSLRGGMLDVSGIYDDTKPGSPLTGTVSIGAFRIADAPVLAKILTLGSLTGIGDTLSGEGIFFKRLDLPFAITENRIHVNDARMSGPAIGLTMNGQVDRASDRIDMEGTLVPAYTINSFLGQVPLIGPLIVGRDGEGIFAITYTVRGQSDDPAVIVNPLSALAPGFLRRLFEFGSTLPPESAPDGGAPDGGANFSGTSPPAPSQSLDQSLDNGGPSTVIPAPE
ncbi:MAG: DUF3971 domain-containing protein [Parvibaculum sp.]|nr:DUF3971 domain-containing protein [Parvibaculum sp.]